VGRWDRHLQGALLSFRMAPPCTNLNCVCGTDIRSSRIALRVPRFVDGSGNGMTILLSLFDQLILRPVIPYTHRSEPHLTVRSMFEEEEERAYASPDNSNTAPAAV
jgi:hypothetical protein